MTVIVLITTIALNMSKPYISMYISKICATLCHYFAISCPHKLFLTMHINEWNFCMDFHSSIHK